MQLRGRWCRHGSTLHRLDGTTGTVGQEKVHYSWNAYTDTLTATGPRGALFKVVVTNPATGAYTVTLVDNVLQAQGPNDENDATAALTYTITDADGSSATGTLNITFNDDAPTATAEASRKVAEGAMVTGTFDFAAGADGATVTHVNGKPLLFGYDGYSQAIDIGDGSIRVKADGSYRFTADDPVIGTGAASAIFTVTDRDGDTATAGVSFVITDDNVPTGGTTVAAVDDDGLTGGNPASVTGDLAVPNSDGDYNEATFGGTLAFSFGGDGAGTVELCVDGWGDRNGGPGEGPLQLERALQRADGDGAARGAVHGRGDEPGERRLRGDAGRQCAAGAGPEARERRHGGVDLHDHGRGRLEHDRHPQHHLRRRRSDHIRHPGCDSAKCERYDFQRHLESGLRRGWDRNIQCDHVDAGLRSGGLRLPTDCAGWRDVAGRNDRFQGRRLRNLRDDAPIHILLLLLL